MKTNARQMQLILCNIDERESLVTKMTESYRNHAFSPNKSKPENFHGAMRSSLAWHLNIHCQFN